MTLSTLATIYGCCGLFDLCSDQDLMSLSFEGTNKFLDWIGWERTDVCRILKNFITYIRPEDSGGNRSAGYIADPCGASNGVEWGSCDFSLEDFGLIRRHSPERNVTKVALRLCDIQPRYRLDGTPITNDLEYDMRLVTESIIQDLKLMLINGSILTAGQFDGLQRLIKTGYKNTKGHYCRSMDSVVINWNSKNLSGGAGITWNGKAVAATYTFVDVLMAAVRHIKHRIMLSPALASQGMAIGDMIFVAPHHINSCLMDAYTCWSVCPGQQYNEVNLNTYEARQFRDKLLGGAFGFGRIFVDGVEIPLMDYDWGMVNQVDADSQCFLLTGQVGAVKLISGQYNDLTSVPTTYPEALYSYTDGGRLLTWTERTKTCVYREVEMQPRLLMWAPWAQARFDDVRCATIGPIISPDPWETSFFPETSFSAALCP